MLLEAIIQLYSIFYRFLFFFSGRSVFSSGSWPRSPSSRTATSTRLRWPPTCRKATGSLSHPTVPTNCTYTRPNVFSPDLTSSVAKFRRGNDALGRCEENWKTCHFNLLKESVFKKRVIMNMRWNFALRSVRAESTPLNFISNNRIIRLFEYEVFA